MNRRPLYIYGAGGLGKEIAALVYEINRKTPSWELKGFFDDAWPEKSECYDLPVVGDSEKLSAWDEEIALVIAIGSPKIKKQVFEKLPSDRFIFPKLIHPAAVFYNRERISVGEGTIIGAGSVLTTDIEIGKHVLINLNTTVGHDCHIEDCSSIMPGVNLAGGVHLESSVFVGSGANVVNAVKLGQSSRIGAGAVVLKDVEAGDTVVGIPARKVGSSI